jgi:hypothetical protein
MELANKGFSNSIWFTNTNSTYTYLRLRLLRRGKGHAHIIKHTGSRLRKTPSTEKVFLITSQMLVLAPAQYKKKLFSFEQLPSLYSICAAGIVYLKTSLSLSRALRAFARQTAPRCRFYNTTTTLVFSSYAVVNKRLKPSASIGPSLVLCLIHCRSPTPSTFYFALQS